MSSIRKSPSFSLPSKASLGKLYMQEKQSHYALGNVTSTVNVEKQHYLFD